MKIVLAIIASVLLVAFGVYVDIAWLLVPGITEVIHGFQAQPVAGGQVAWGIVKVLFSGIATYLAFLISFILLAVTLKGNHRSLSRRWYW